MTKKEVEQLNGKFGEIAFNGIFYPSKVSGFIREVEGSKVRIERLEGNDIWVRYDGLKFTPRRLKICL
jgi:hypothetical protein